MRTLMISVVVILSTIWGCGPSLKQTSNSTTQDLPDTTKMTHARVIDYSDLDGCTFLLELDDGSKLQPLTLAEEFMKDGLSVYITYSIVKQPGICMVGRIINVDQIVRSEK